MITREFEKAGIPIVQWCNMIPVAESIGVNRLMESKSIKYPFGNPDVPPEQEKIERVQMLKKALTRLTQP